MSRTPQRIVIVGFMAAGKTSLAKSLARRLSCEMIDLDEIISEHEGRTIAELIRKRGEDIFRGAETLMLHALLEKSHARIIALGGGAWTIERNRNLIAEHNCLTVWLDAPFNLCWKRIEDEQGSRPLALDRQSAHRLYRARRPLYSLAALHLPVTEEKSADDLVAELLKMMRRPRFS